jgi:hypothetical protein
MWMPRCLTILRASTACYSDSFSLILHYMLFAVHLQYRHYVPWFLVPCPRTVQTTRVPVISFLVIELSLLKFSVTMAAGYPIWYPPLCGLPIILAFFHIADNIWDRFSPWPPFLMPNEDDETVRSAASGLQFVCSVFFFFCAVLDLCR